MNNLSIEATILHLHKRKEATVLVHPTKRAKLCGTDRCCFLVVENAQEVDIQNMGRGLTMTEWSGETWKA